MCVPAKKISQKSKIKTQIEFKHKDATKHKIYVYVFLCLNALES
jgi:hypothetical protein